ncbi:MAG: STAS domain-containing protein [Tepidisphaeraceae bacterium]|jgi:anti-anti-sigma factor
MTEIIMSSELFHVVKESSVNVIGLTIPDGLDSMELDALIDNVLAGINPAAGTLWVADLSGVAYMGSSLLGLMVNIREAIRQSGGKLILCGVAPGLARVFQNCCLERLFIFARNRAEAITMAKR